MKKCTFVQVEKLSFWEPPVKICDVADTPNENVLFRIRKIRKFPKGKMISIDDGWIDIFIPAWSIGSRSLPWIINQMISAASIREQKY